MPVMATSRPPARTATASVLAVLVVVVALAVSGRPAGAQEVPAAPSPEELCAALEGAPGYEECVAGTRDALDGVDPAPPATVDQGRDTEGEPTDGATLAEENLDEQRRLLWVIVAGVLAVVYVVVALSWWRAMRRMRRTFSPETLALMDAMIPPEVRAARPDATVGDGLTEKERALLRSQRNLVIGLLVLPAAVFVLLQVWEPSVDTSVAIGEVARIAPLVLALPALWWARRRVRRAIDAGDDRWEILGLRTESGPGVTVLPRADGTLRAAVYGDTVLVGQRFGRAVRIELSQGAVRTCVQVPGIPDAGPTAEPGPGGATLTATSGWLVLQRGIGGAALAREESLATVLHDLQRVEQVAAGPVPA